MQIVSHRLRGFDLYENSLAGVRNALSAGVSEIEFDIRFTADEVPVVWHNISVECGTQSPVIIARKSLYELKKILSSSLPGFTFCTFEELLETAASFPGVRLWIDIKEYGKEQELLSLIAQYNLLSRVVIVSWLPEVLRSFYALNPELPLCFSHLPGGKVKALGIRLLYQSGVASIAGINNTANTNTEFRINDYNKDGITQIRGIDYEHFLTAPVQGPLLSALRNSNGYVCIRRDLITGNHIEYYTKNGVKVVLYSVKSSEELAEDYNKFSPAGVLSDAREVSVLNTFGK